MSSRVIYPLQRSGNLLFLRASVSGTNNDLIRVRLGMDILSQIGAILDIQKAEIAVVRS